MHSHVLYKCYCNNIVIIYNIHNVFYKFAVMKSEEKYAFFFEKSPINN